MRRKFNVTGVMIPGKHFMVDTSHKIAQMIEMVEAGDYFVIARPRQYGKTTTLMLLENALNQREDCLALQISFEGMGEESFHSERQFVQTLGEAVKQSLKLLNEERLVAYLQEQLPQLNSMPQLSQTITDLCTLTSQKLVLLIDEVDKSSNYEMVISFLGMLREKYLLRNQGKTKTFQSVILAGVHDVKSLKLKIRPESKAQQGSPWNIAAKFEVDLSFSPEEIAQMLQGYVQETHVQLDVKQVAQQIYDYTSGYPFLVSALCKIMDEKTLPTKPEKVLTLADCENAVSQLLEEENTNFESVIKNLENNPDLAQLVSAILLEGKAVSFTITNPLIQQGITYGIFYPGRRGGHLKVHNRIYEALIYDYLESKLEISELLDKDNGCREEFVTEANELNMKKLLLKFQEFMKDNYASREQGFLEREGRLLFLAFLKPIINGYGYSFKEVLTSEEKRLDVVVTFLQKKYVVELKIWRGEEAHGRGLKQLADYLDRQSVGEGYLLIYDFRREKSYRSEEITASGKKVFVVWV